MKKQKVKKKDNKQLTKDRNFIILFSFVIVVILAGAVLYSNPAVIIEKVGTTPFGEQSTIYVHNVTWDPTPRGDCWDCLIVVRSNDPENSYIGNHAKIYLNDVEQGYLVSPYALLPGAEIYYSLFNVPADGFTTVKINLDGHIDEYSSWVEVT